VGEQLVCYCRGVETDLQTETLRAQASHQAESLREIERQLEKIVDQIRGGDTFTRGNLA
jgi:hypothetical protein